MTIEEALKMTESEIWYCEQEKEQKDADGLKFENQRTLDCLLLIREVLCQQLEGIHD